MDELKTLTDFIPFAIKPLHLQVIDRLQKVHHVEDCALLHPKHGRIVSANKALSLRLSESEASQLVDILKDPNAARAKGTIDFLGHTYDVIRADAYSIYCQTSSRHGLILVSGEDYITVVTYNSSMSPSVSVEAAEKMGRYFLLHPSTGRNSAST